MRLKVGTSGFSYPAWKGTLYPKSAKPNEFLGLYAEHFDTVELNATFYRTPPAGMLEKFRETVGRKFVFAVKAHRALTHMRRLLNCDERVPLFLEELAPLGERLGPILFQLPPNMKFDGERLEKFLPLLPRAQKVAFEFRHESFFTGEAEAILTDHGAALVISDEEEALSVQLARLPAKRAKLFSYVRLRQETYEDKELAAVLALLAKRGGDAFVYVKHEVTGPALAEKVARLAEKG
jgi:uncharacterized protein YecE (DUF72 family)